MHGSATLKKVVAAWVTMCMILSSFGMMTIAEDETQVNNVTDGGLVFKGFDLKYGANNSIQALVDVYVDNIDATGIDFTLIYDSEYLEPSSYATNDATTKVREAFEPNGAIFTSQYPVMIFDEDETDVPGIESSAIDQNESFIRLNLAPSLNSEGSQFGTAHISSPEEADVIYVKSNGGEVKWGTISFIVHKPVELCNMDATQLKKVLYVSGDPEIDGDPEDDEPYDANIIYVGNDRYEHFNGPKLPVKWQVSSDIYKAEPAKDSSTVSAYSVFQRQQTGTTADLLRYLNQEMGSVKEYYKNGENKMSTILWNSTAVITDENGTTITDANYDPRGGHTYTVTQNYLDNPNINITVTVKVTKSELTGFEYDKRIKTFYGTRPSVWNDLDLPPYITPVITGTDDLFTAPKDTPASNTDWNPSAIPSSLQGTDPASATFWHPFDKSVLGILAATDDTKSSTFPWLSFPPVTDDSFWKIDAIRNLVTDTSVSPPQDGHITAEVDRITGNLIINIGAGAFTSWIDRGTSFNIYLPNGTVLSTYTNGDFVTAVLDTVNQTAVVTISATRLSSDPNDNTMRDDREWIQSIINSGSSDFTISAVKTFDGPPIESEVLPFTFSSRINYYFGDKDENGDEKLDSQNRKYVEKDYSGPLVSLFRVYEEQELSEIPKFIVFPDNSTIETAYNGQTGYQKPFVNTSDPNPALLDRAKVVKWSWEYADGTAISTEDPDKLPSAGKDIYLVGKLAPNYYTNYGYVFNPEPTPTPAGEVYLKLKLTTLAKPTPTATPGPTATPEVTPSPTPGTDPTDTPSPTPEPTATPGPNMLRISTMLNGGDGNIGSGPEVELNKKTFEYDRKQKGYQSSDVQDQVYRLENIGSNDLTSLSVRIDNVQYAANETDTPQDYYSSPFIMGYDRVYTRTNDPSNPGTYIITSNVSNINAGNEAYVNIRTVHGLNPGIYTARVFVNTISGGDIEYFDIRFKVTDGPVYKVVVNNVDPSAGYGYLIADGGNTVASSTYEVGETVSVFAVIVDTAGYIFENWTCEPPDTGRVTFADATQLNTSFVMVAPANGTYITVTPIFAETDDVWVRLADLRSYNDGDANPNPLKNPSSFANMPFAETTYDYAVVVDGAVNRNYVEFDLKDKLLDTAYTDGNDPMTVKMTFNGNPLSCTETNRDSVNSTVTYQSDKFDLSDPGPDLVTITTEYVDKTTDPANPKTYTKTYTLKIYRKSAVQVDKQYGNSPMGLIYRSFADDLTKRAAAKAHFEANHTYVAYDSTTGAYDDQYTPDLAATTYETLYSTEAWGTGKNYDNDEYALFVYQGEKFVDPGFKNLKYMDNKTDVPANSVTRTIEGIYTYAPTTGGILADLDAATAQTAVTVGETGDTDVLINELSAMNIRPGIYTLKYSFIDQDGSSSSFSRPLIVLAHKGNLNMDNSLKPDNDDADIIYQRMNSNSLYEKAINATDDWRLLYAYRVGDVTEDRNVNSIDANAVLDTVNNNAVYREYYEKLPSAAPEPSQTAEPWPTIAPGTTPKPIPTLPPDKATLVLDYLGVSTDVRDVALEPALTKENNEYSADKIADDPFAAYNSMIWVGIGIENPANLAYFLDGLYSVDLAIDYDTYIFEPCDGSALINGEAGFTKATYIDMINDNNLTTDTSITAADNALWRNGKVYEESLRTDLNLDESGRYKTVFVTIKSSDLNHLRLNGVTDNTKTKYLLRLPFRLKHFPTEEEAYTGQPLKIHTTEQTFVLGATSNGVKNSASWEGLVNKTTEVNNARNHFDGDPRIVDIFGTDGKFKVKGVITGWNPQKPFVAEFFKVDNPTDTADYILKSDDVNEANAFVNGTLTYTPEGKVQWNFELPISNLFDYKLRISKLSHVTYPEFEVTRPQNSDTVTLDNQIDLIVGDIDKDSQVKIPDRVSLMRFFDQHKPWSLYKDRFEAADLNGDNAVNLFDLNLLKQNMEKAYPEPTVTPEGGGTG